MIGCDKTLMRDMYHRLSAYTGNCVCIFFFFQAEDGIRFLTVTGVQTCALPICAAGAVSALTTSPAGNAVVVYQRGADGSLTPDGLFATGGLGTGSSLGSQGGVIVSDDHQLLFAVNAGDNTISSYRIRPDGLELADTASSGRTMPPSAAFFRRLPYGLYVR